MTDCGKIMISGVWSLFLSLPLYSIQQPFKTSNQNPGMASHFPQQENQVLRNVCKSAWSNLCYVSVFNAYYSSFLNSAPIPLASCALKTPGILSVLPHYATGWIFLYLEHYPPRCHQCSFQYLLQIPA